MRELDNNVPAYHIPNANPEWCTTMSEVITALESNDTWNIQALPKGKKTIECRWVYKTKV